MSPGPVYPLRGHQLGYRPKTNSYDAWTVEMWEQYYRDLVVFGTNAVELIPPTETAGGADSPHMPLPMMDMMVEMSRLADDYGLEVWIWYPPMELVEDGEPDADGRAFLVWTTTPWTVPSNVGLAIHPNLRYVEAAVDGRRLVLAEDPLDLRPEHLAGNQPADDLDTASRGAR